MYLKHIRARNYRAFGDGASSSAPALDWELSPGLNILVGENDAGKTGIVDAIRQVLLTTSYEPVRLFEQDFHIEGANRAHIEAVSDPEGADAKSVRRHVEAVDAPMCRSERESDKSGDARRPYRQGMAHRSGDLRFTGLVLAGRRQFEVHQPGRRKRPAWWLSGCTSGALPKG